MHRKPLSIIAFVLILALAFSSGIHAQTVLRFAEQAGTTEILEDYFIPLYEELTGVRVVIEALPPDQMWQRMMLEAQSGSNYYDLGYHSPGWFGYYYEHVADLTPFIEEHDFQMDQYEQSIIDSHMTSAGMRGEDIIALPKNPQTPILIYREDWFSNSQEQDAFQEQHGRALAVPETWAELYEVAKFFTREAGEQVAGETLERTLFGYGDSVRAPGGMARAFLALFYSLGLDGFDENFVPDIDHPILLEGVSFWADLVNDTFPPAAVNWDFLEHLEYFREGRLAMALLWPEGVITVEDPAGQAAGNIGYDVLPRWEGNLKDLPQGRSFLGGGGTLVFDTPQADEAFKFLQWLYEEMEIEWVMKTSMFSRTNQFENQEVLASQPYYEKFLPAFQAAMPYAFARQPIPEYGSVMYTAAGEFASDVLHEILTPEQAQQRWVDHMQREFDRAGY